MFKLLFLLIYEVIIMIGIYKVTNQKNGKVYIGQSVNIKRRWSKHKNSPFNPNALNYDCIFYRAIRKYGIESFKFEVLEECNIDELNDKEIYWINYYNSVDRDKGYNMTEGGHIPHPNILTEDDVQEIINLLLTTNLNQTEIAQEFDVSQRMISAINLGESWNKGNLKYPLRDREKIKELNSNVNKCLRCGKIISRGANYCVNCYNLLNRKVERPDRETLKREIRTNSFLSLGKKYGVSDNAVRRWCDSYSLPRRSKDIKNFSDEEWAQI